MRKPKYLFGLIATCVVALSSQVQAAIPTYTELSNNGTLEVTTYLPSTSVGIASITSPYGAPTITQIASGWVLTFNPSSAFFVSANNFGGGKTSTLAAKLDFYVTFSSAINLTANIYEDGIYNTTGNGTASVFGGIKIQEGTHSVPSEHSDNGNLASAVIYNANAGSWSANIQAGGAFLNTYNSYHIIVDNDLTAESLFNGGSPGSATIAKKDFKIVLTFDGSSGSGQGPTVPEPASLSILAIGAGTLLTRRRKA